MLPLQVPVGPAGIFFATEYAHGPIIVPMINFSGLSAETSALLHSAIRNQVYAQKNTT